MTTQKPRSGSCVVVCLYLLGMGCGGGDALPPGVNLADSDVSMTTTSGGVDVSTADVEVFADAVSGDLEAPDLPVDTSPSLDSGDELDSGQESRAYVRVPLGETLFFDGDDYLATWGVDVGQVEVAARPEGSVAQIINSLRLTPDAPGSWRLRRGVDVVTVDVYDNRPDADTFLNYNYTPTSPMALVGEDELWVVSPPSGVIHNVALTAEGPEDRGMVPTGSWPTSVALWEAGNMLLIAQTGRDSLGFLDLESRRMIDALKVGDEPADVVVGQVDGVDVAWVTLSGADQVVQVNLERRDIDGRLAVGRDPRALVWDGDRARLYVASMLSGNAHPRGILQETPLSPGVARDVAIIDTASWSIVGWSQPAGTIIRGLLLDPDDPSRLIVASSEALNDAPGVDADVRAHLNGLTVLDVSDVGEGAVAAEVDLDQQPSSSGAAVNPHAVSRTPSGSRWIVTLSGSKALLVLDGETMAEEGRISTGHDPRGLVFAQGRVWSFATLSNSLQSWEIPDGRPMSAIDATLVELEIGDDPTPTDIKRGQQIFNDASFSRNNDFACNNCHIDGLTDGLVWNLLLDGDVNTLPFRNIAGTDPFLWGGFLPTLFDFSREVLRLVGANASGEQMELLTRYMQSVTAPPNPHTLPGGRLTASGERGKAHFFGAVSEPGGAGCGVCHSGPLFTARFAVEGKTPGVDTDVPSLIGVYDTGPWGREAQWSTLEGMVEFAVEYTGADLDEGQRGDLLSYVRQIPGDILYLNGSRPLKGSRNVWYQTPVVLSFSSVLKPAQSFAFLLEREREGEWSPVNGVWAISGKYARFEGELELDTRYRIGVAEGLEGIYGRKLRDDLEVVFETGSIPEVDVSGEWLLRVSGPVTGSGVGAFLQTRGGYVSGTSTVDNSLIDFDHVEGYVSGRSLVLDPFTVLTSFGDFLVTDVQITMADDDGDGYAERGSGVLRSIVDLEVVLERISLPDSE